MWTAGMPGSCRCSKATLWSENRGAGGANGVIARRRLPGERGRYRKNLPSLPGHAPRLGLILARSEEHTSELQSLMRISYAVFCLKKKKTTSHASTSRHD